MSQTAARAAQVDKIKNQMMQVGMVLVLLGWVEIGFAGLLAQVEFELTKT
jgi:hypothetical protein